MDDRSPEKRVCTVVGARPQFIKAAVVSHALSSLGIEEVMVHTGQHYDQRMSQVFFDELGIDEPWKNLEVGSASHAEQTAQMMIRLEQVLHKQPSFDWMLVYGDTNSTMAAALVASKLELPIAHVESGLRSYNRSMPEEINRVVTDHLSTRLFCPTNTAVRNLEKEGIIGGVVLAGDVMLDATLFFAARSEEAYQLHDLTHHKPSKYYLATIHRAENTDDAARLNGILEGLGRLELPVILPIHPRTRYVIGERTLPRNVDVIEPISYLAMLQLIRNARAILTDSGGLQKEAYWLGIPCVTLREETEWVETLEGGWNALAGADPEAIVEGTRRRPSGEREPFGAAPSGSASQLIASSFRHR